MMHISEISDRQIAAFWAKVARGSPEACWDWTATKTSTGYGRFMIRKGQRYRSFKAARLAYYLTHGQLDDDLVILHSCDNRACCNPAHLSLGTMLENVTDMWRKGRGHPSVGESNGQAKLTEDDIRLIRQTTGRGSSAALARNYGVSSTLICNIKKRRAWRHVQ